MTFDSAFAQGLVKGRITGRNAEPLPFATIGILSRNAMTTSDLDGRFSILANPEDTLEIYYLGYYTAQIPVGTTTEFNITLRESTQQMDELVIVGYGSSRKKDLTGAASHINFDEFNGGMHSNPMTKLQGKVSGFRYPVIIIFPGEQSVSKSGAILLCLVPDSHYMCLMVSYWMVGRFKSVKMV